MMMMRKRSTLMFAVLSLALGYLGASVAFSASDTTRQSVGIPASALPVSVPTSDTKMAIFSLIVSAGADIRYGISESSFEQARKITDASAGDLFLIPGTTGMCLASTVAVSCGELNLDSPMITLFTRDPISSQAVGGGITLDAVGSVTVSADGIVVKREVENGVFSIAARDNLPLLTTPVQVTMSR